jgi:glutamate:Na+ symporter, ESS family
MYSEWKYPLMILYIFVFMFIAKVLKEKLGIFKSIVVPTSLLAGFVGLLMGPEVLGAFDFEFFGRSVNLGVPYDPRFYVEILFFFMIIAFVSLTLTERNNKQNAKSLDSGIFIVSTYVLQGLIGLSVVYIMIWTFWPKFFAGMGLMLPLAFGQGPGFSSSIGEGWDKETGINYIQQFGITLSTVGFVVGGIIGVILLNYYIKKYNLNPVKLNQLKGVNRKKVEFETLSEVNFFDHLLVQITFLALIMLTTYLFTFMVYHLVYPLDSSVANLLKSFSYLFGIFIAMGLRGFLRKLEENGHRTKPLINDYIMQNIASFSLNVMITASVMSIEIETIKQYYPVLIGVTLFGTLGTLLYVVFFGRYVFKGKYVNHYILAMFGMLTGVASTGLALLRGVDPDLETEVSDNVVVLGSAIAAPIGLPIMLLLGVQLKAFTLENNLYNVITYFTLLAYLLLLISIMVLRVKLRNKKQKD